MPTGSSVKDIDLSLTSLSDFRKILREQAKSLGPWELLPQIFLELIETTRPSRVGIFAPKSEWAEANNIREIFASLPETLQKNIQILELRIDGDDLVFGEGEIPDLLLVPALACDKEGKRLGRGKGYYDRFLAKHGSQLKSCVLIHSCFLFDNLPSEYFHAGDQKVHYVLTEQKLFKNDKNGNEVQI